MKYTIADHSLIPQLTEMRLRYIEVDQGELTAHNRVAMEQRLPKYFSKHLGDDLIAFVALDGDCIVATALLLIIEKPSNPHFIHGKIGEVLNVYTRENYQHQGIATHIIENLLSFARNTGLDYVELSATEEGYPLYQKCGFTETTSPYRSMRYSM